MLKGGELAVLRGAVDIISDYKPIISFELGNTSLINYQYIAKSLYFDYRKTVISSYYRHVSGALSVIIIKQFSYTSKNYYDYFYDLGYVIYSIFGVPLSREELVHMSEEQFFWDYIAIHNKENFRINHNHIRVMVEQIWQA